VFCEQFGGAGLFSISRMYLGEIPRIRSAGAELPEDVVGSNVRVILDRALFLLGEATRLGFDDSGAIRNDPLFSPILDDPRLVSIVEQIEAETSPRVDRSREGQLT
jgi:hypothetical protein